MKRTPLKRRTPLRDGPSIARERHPIARQEPKERTCEHCGKSFVPARMGQKVCPTVRCAKGYVAKQKAADKTRDRERKEALKRIPDLIREAQHEFNAYIRERDRDQPCICCGSPLGEGDVGGAYDCGHYRSTGSAPHLRFDERNAHAQRKVCNRYGAGRAVDYRIGLLARIGREAVEALEADNRVRKWDRESLIAIKNEYRAKLRELKKTRND